MDQRLQFVTDALSDRFTMTELCERYGVSRRIGYKWLARFNEDGKRGLRDRSRRAHTCPTEMRPVIAELLCEFRRLHPDWGARQLSALRPAVSRIPLSVTMRSLPRRIGLAMRNHRIASEPSRSPHVGIILPRLRHLLTIVA